MNRTKKPSSPVQLADCKKGDIVFYRPKNEPEGMAPPKRKHRLGTILTINQQRGTLRLTFRAMIDGKMVEDCRTRIRPEQIIGFHIRGTPL